MVDSVFANVLLYEPVIAGNPFYIWVIMGLVVMLMFGLAIFKLEVFDRMAEVWGYRDACLNKTPLAIIIGMSGKIWMKSVESIAGIFTAMGLPLKWIQTAPTQGQLGVCNTIIVSDDFNIVHNVDIDYAIVHAVHQWNEKNPEGTDGFIYDYETFEEHLMNGDLDAMFPEGVVLPPFRRVNLHEIRKYLPVWTASAHSGYIQAELDKNKPDKDEEGSKRIMLYLLAGGVGIVICSIIAYMIVMQASATALALK